MQAGTTPAGTAAAEAAEESRGLLRFGVDELEGAPYVDVPAPVRGHAKPAAAAAAGQPAAAAWASPHRFRCFLVRRPTAALAGICRAFDAVDLAGAPPEWLETAALVRLPAAQFRAWAHTPREQRPPAVSDRGKPLQLNGRARKAIEAAVAAGLL
jgi:hypothetical protein